MANIVLDFLHNYQTGERRETEPANAYQYDEGHVLEAILPEVITSCEIHYWIRGMEEADAYTPTSITPNSDGSCTVLGNIPNSYFETNGELRIYIVVTDGTASITTYEGKLHIAQRAMPDDYVDEDPENEATRVLNEAREAAQQAAASAQICQEVEESIPEDYSQLSEDVSNLKDDFSDTEEWLGYPKNLFDARDLTVSNTNNWSIDSSTKTSMTITHKNTYGVGHPIALLNLPTGKYDFHANYGGSSTQFSLRVNGSWVKALADGAEIDIDSSNTNEIYFSNSVAGTYTITDISVTAKEQNGKVQTIEDNIAQLTEATSAHERTIEDLQVGFNDIAELDINSLVGVETQKAAINASGTVYEAGSLNYRLVKFDVTAGKKYWITANTNWGNLLWCFYNASDAVVALGQASARESADTIITNTEVTAPAGASYVLVAYNSTVAPVDCKTQTGYVLKGKWKGKKWVCVGDSLTAENSRTTKHYFDYVAEETGITTVNMGDSGSGYAREQDVDTAFYQRIGDCPTDADVVTIFGSFNDLGAGLQIGTVDDTGTTTLAGCINTTIDNLQAVIPLVNLGIVAPTPWDTTQPSTSGNAYNYVEMLKAICERRSIPFLDLWRCSNLRPWDADFRQLAYSKDGGSGTHPDENGHKLIAPRFKGFLETLLM